MTQGSHGRAPRPLKAHPGARTIAVVTTSYPLNEADAAGHFVQAECRELANSGHRVIVLRPGPVQAATVTRDMGVHSGRLEVLTLPGGEAFGWPGVLARLRQRPVRLLSIAGFAWRARRALRAIARDEVIAHWLLPGGWPIAAGMSNTTAVAHGSDVLLLQRLPRPIAALLLGRILRRAELRSVSFRGRDELAAIARSALRSRILRSEVTPVSLNLPHTSARSSARAALNMGEGFVAVVASRLIASKRVDVALGKAQLPPGARCFVVGDGPALDSLKENFPAVVFLGRLPHAATLTWIAAADVLLSASLLEGAPTAIREARHLGTRVWCADAGDVARWAAEDSGIELRSEFDAAEPVPRPLS